MTARPSLGKVAARARSDIYELIESGVFPPGHKLPGERELAERLSVSRSVLRAALASLADDGRLENSPWRGWFVTSPHMADQITLRSFSEMARARGLVPGSRILSRDTRAATLAEASALGIAPAAKVHEIHRVRTLSGVPSCYDVSILPLSRVEGIEGLDLDGASLYLVLERDYDIRVVRTDYVMRADAAPAGVAQALLVGVGDPVLVGEETASDIGGLPVLLGRVTYRRDAYEFQATLWRPYEPTPS
ncbi:MAG: GntR family transcriptional regulator [Arachnia sp.]